MSPRKRFSPKPATTTKKRKLSVEEMKVAYEEACRQGQDGYRLFYAQEIARNTKESYWRIKCAQEWQQSFMHIRAEKVLLEVLGKEPDNLECILTLAENYLERFKLGDAEEMFRKSVAIQESEAARRGMETIARLGNENSWTDEERRHKKFWDEMAMRERIFPDMTEEQQKRALAKILVEGYWEASPA